ncbi:unnamed protein product [Sphenostylis stenocarpa]|uniref:Stomagen C-terminal domain-containing protein n=1 Tax=Sphenostylis stenocarpa TaxID=92480 RepID=A0AA86RUD4_9FABA|nr:unnamed protein product [Sphenostylis stenocarpa]
MGDTKLPEVLLLLFTIILAARFTQGIKTEELLSQSSEHQREPSLEDGNEAWKMRNSRRLMIGSTAPTCTYNECRGCKYKCKAEQVPVEGNDPINSPYHYRCLTISVWHFPAHYEVTTRRVSNRPMKEVKSPANINFITNLWTFVEYGLHARGNEVWICAILRGNRKNMKHVGA